VILFSEVHLYHPAAPIICVNHLSVIFTVGAGQRRIQKKKRAAEMQNPSIRNVQKDVTYYTG
jgi:hypothetical protein